VSNDDLWVFGYGSLVSPASLARTVERAVPRDEGFLAAYLGGYGRRWNYGSVYQRGNWDGPHGRVESGVVVSLGLAIAETERSNGVIVRVSEDELALLDWRERDYDQTDVTDRVDAENGSFGGRVFTFVPRPSAIERYERHRDGGRAAIATRYVDLVEAAFTELGDHHLDEYVSATPEPDVPVVPMEPAPPAR